jgi:two-component system, LytTR family, response regulator
MTMTCILLDDESDCLELLKLSIEQRCPELRILGQYQEPEAGIEAIKNLRPNLVFLDVDMPRINGFGVLEACRGVPFQIIFTTAYQEYAIRAFKYSATGYLLKPIDKQDLWEAVQKARHMDSVQQLAEQREVLFNYLHPSAPKRDKIALHTGDGIMFLPVNDILFCKAEGNYTYITLEGRDQPMLFVVPLKEIEEMLSGGPFCRPHNSYVVNLDKVEQFLKGDNIGLKMRNNDKCVPVARSKKQEVLDRLQHLARRWSA